MRKVLLVFVNTKFKHDRIIKFASLLISAPTIPRGNPRQDTSDSVVKMGINILILKLLSLSPELICSRSVATKGF